MTQELTVEQCDREAAASLAEWLTAAETEWEADEGVARAPWFHSSFPDAARKGIWDSHDFVQAFARHRTEALAASDKGEVEARVAMEFCGERAAKAVELLQLMASENGRMDANDERIQAYCDDGPGIDDTINRCFDAEYLDQVQTGDDDYVIVLLDKGREALSSLPQGEEG